MSKLMNIQQFSEQTNISKSALRFYEQKQLLFPQERSANGYRVYAEDQIATVKLIASLRLANLSIKEIKEYLQECDASTNVRKLDSQHKKETGFIKYEFLRYLESESFAKEIYLIEKSPEQIIWFNAESKVGEFRQHFIEKRRELEKRNIPSKNFYLKYVSGDQVIKAQIGFGVPNDFYHTFFEEAVIEQLPKCICKLM